MDKALSEDIISLAQRIIVHMTYFTKPEFTENLDIEDSWVGRVDTVTKALPLLLVLYEKVCSDDLITKLEEEENAALRRGFFRSMVDASETQASVINRVLQDKDIDLYNSRVASIARQLNEALGGFINRKTVMEDLVKSLPGHTTDIREIERLNEGLTNFSTTFLQLDKSLAMSVKLCANLNKQLKKKLKRAVKKPNTKQKRMIPTK